jgi:lysophospholipase L1-like esterase
MRSSLVLALTGVLLTTGVSSVSASAARWTGVWASSPQQAVVFEGLPNWSVDGFSNQTLRQVVRVSGGGSAVRVRLSNAYGSAPLRVTGASIARSADGASVVPESLRPLTFGFRHAAVVPVGRSLVSDPVVLPFAALSRLTVTLYFAGTTGPATTHVLSSSTSYRASGDHRFARDGGAFGETDQSYHYLTGVEAIGHAPRASVVAFGDSVTDGTLSTPDANNRYPDDLAERLGGRLAVLNAGIGGNRVLRDSPCFGESAVNRFERDALNQPGVRTVIVLQGVNDLIDLSGTVIMPNCNRPNPDIAAAHLIEGHRALIRAAHARGVRIIGGTTLPYKGNPYGFFTERGETIRDEVNHWIRTGGEYDAVVDFERVLADPADPDQLNPALDFGDKIHPNDAGYHAMAAAIPLDAL